MQAPQAQMLPDRRRLHLNHGPIDLIIEAFGEAEEVRAAYAQAVSRFKTILAELVAELPVLRTPVLAPRKQTAWPVLDAPPHPSSASLGHPLPAGERRLASTGGYLPRSSSEAGRWTTSSPQRGEGGVAKRRPGEGALVRSAAVESFPVAGPTARRMYAAVLPHAESFITPMAAVAGSVADEIMAAMIAGRLLEKAYVNNGGDVAVYLRPDAVERDGTTRDAPPPEPKLTIAIAGTGHGFADHLTIRAGDPVRGIATSGWRGRSFSLGIADAVTVLAHTAADADAAATIIANAVDLPGNPAVVRRAANELAPDSDLGELPVTVAVGPLMRNEIVAALHRGLAVAWDLKRRGMIEAAALFLGGESWVCGELAFQSRAEDIHSPSRLAKPHSYLSARPHRPPEDYPHA